MQVLKKRWVSVIRDDTRENSARKDIYKNAVKSLGLLPTKESQMSFGASVGVMSFFTTLKKKKRKTSLLKVHK